MQLLFGELTGSNQALSWRKRDDVAADLLLIEHMHSNGENVAHLLRIVYLGGCF